MKKTILTLLTIIVALSCYASCISGDCVNGKGTYKLKSGSIYKGEFKQGKPHGVGLIKTNKGICRTNWRSGKKEGKAVWKLNDDTKLYCSYKNNKKHGKGKRVNVNDKTIAIYLWKNGKLIKEKKAKNGSFNKKRKKSTSQQQTKKKENLKKLESADSNSDKVESQNGSSKKVEESPSTSDKYTKEDTVEEVKPDLQPGQMVGFGETYSYNTGDGSLFGNLLGSYLKANFTIQFYGVVEQKLGDRYKIVITNGEIVDPGWASMNYYDYKPYAARDMNQKIGNTVFMTIEEVTLLD